MNAQNKELTPAQIVAELDRFIIGQEEAKKSVAIASRERWRRQKVQADIREEILPSNILMKGSTGTGKTEIGRRLAKLSNVPFIKVEATEYTERGYVGSNVENMIHLLVARAFSLVRKEKQKTLKKEVQQAVENKILNILVPPLTRSAEADQENRELNYATREKFREKIRNGTLDNRQIEISYYDNPALAFNNAMMEAQMIPFHDMLQRFIPKKEKKKSVTIKEAKEILLEEELNRLIDPETLKEETVKKAEEGIVFIDEIDKIASHYPKGQGPDVSREGVQRNLLPIIEGTTVNTRYGNVKTDHILFIAAGAFHNNKVSDLMPELQGRFPIRVEFHSLTEEDLYYILDKPQNALIKQQIALFAAEEVALSFTEEAKKKIAYYAHAINQELENIGARRLRTVLMHLLEDYLFDTPEKYSSGATITIDHHQVQERLAPLLRTKESSQYIL